MSRKIFPPKASKANLVTAKILEINEVQRLHLRLIELASFNEMDGYKIVKDLLNHKDDWIACLIDRPGLANIEEINEQKSSSIIDLIKLRDIVEGIWNADTIYILVESVKIPGIETKLDRMRELVKDWHADDVKELDERTSGYLLGGYGLRLGTKFTTKCKILKLWWD